ncbi:kinase-like domain-containing protein [Xylaria flabelliformis]|nr:kinase-like domain-containing protein [Xylaria flabelliformis]
MDATATDHSALSTSVVRGTDVDHPKNKDLFNAVDNLLRKKCLPQNDIRGFLARGDITTILTERVIWDILSENQSLELNEIVGQILNKDLDKRMIEIFAILIFTGKVEYIQDLVRRGVSDKSLPLVPQEWYERLDFWQRSQYKEEERMPFVYEREIGRGGQGEVNEIKIHPDHLHGDFPWNDEVKALKGADLEHQHLIRLLFAYEHIGKGFYMVFPLAGGNLNPYWEKNNLKVPSSETNRGRHGDIKPSNILWFEDRKHVRGVLVVSDLTMARFHSIDTIDSTSALDRDLSMTYRPPEIDLNPKSRVSQAFDVRSLGCVFFEFVVWYLVGYNAINHEDGFFNDQQKCLSFRHVRLQDDNSHNGRYDDKFFNTFNAKSVDGCDTVAVVKKSVRMVLHDFLDLIMDRIIQLPIFTEDIHAEPLDGRLLGMTLFWKYRRWAQKIKRKL